MLITSAYAYDFFPLKLMKVWQTFYQIETIILEEIQEAIRDLIRTLKDYGKYFPED